MSMISTTYFDIVDFPHNFPPIGNYFALQDRPHLIAELF
jgi:hypothetical protein